VTVESAGKLCWKVRMRCRNNLQFGSIIWSKLKLMQLRTGLGAYATLELFQGDVLSISSWGIGDVYIHT